VRHLFEALGVDRVQWRALVGMHVRLDYSVLLGADGTRAALRAALGLLLLIVLLATFGVPPALVIWFCPDAFLGATAMVTTIAFFVAMSLLLGISSIVAPLDFQIIGCRPVTSRTYFAVRATILLLTASQLAILTGYAPVVAFVTRAGGSWRLGIAAAMAIGASVLAVTFGLIAIYGWLVKVIGPVRLPRMLGYAQMIAGAAILGGYLVLTDKYMKTRDADLAGLTALSLPKNLWTLWYPGTWFASYVEIARGASGPIELVAAALSVLLIAAFALTLRDRLSLDYASRIADILSSSAGGINRKSRSLSFLRDEALAMFILARSQFRDDLTFRLAVLGTVPTLLVFLFFGRSTAGLADPFVFGQGDPFGGPMIVQMVVFFLPTTLRQTLLTSANYQASWMFFTTPADRTRLLMSARDAIALLVLAPIFVLLVGVFEYTFGNIWHAFLHTLVLACLSYLVLQITVLIKPALPFSVPPGKGSDRNPFGLPLLVSFGGMLVYLFFVQFAYATPVRLAIGLVAFATAIAYLNRLTRRRVEALAYGLTYYG
jgi:hypothetical protein